MRRRRALEVHFRALRARFQQLLEHVDEADHHGLDDKALDRAGAEVGAEAERLAPLGQGIFGRVG